MEPGPIASVVGKGRQQLARTGTMYHSLYLWSGLRPVVIISLFPVADWRGCQVDAGGRLLFIIAQNFITGCALTSYTHTSFKTPPTLKKGH